MFDIDRWVEIWVTITRNKTPVVSHPCPGFKKG